MSRAPLRIPEGRQGPGPIPRRVLETLDLIVARRTRGVLPGDRLAAGVGSGTELAQLRPYEVGDDVRQIDPSATARMGEPYVRQHVPERTLTTWLVVDRSPSMAFGTAGRLKYDVAEGAAVVVAHLGVRRAGRVALVTFGTGGVPSLHPPRASKPGVVAVRRALADGVAKDGAADRADFAHALVRVGRVANTPGLIVIVSDFRDQDDWIRPLGVLAARHSVMAIEVRDPREAELPAVGRLALIDPETGERMEVDTSKRLRERFARIEAERRAQTAAELRRLQVDHVVLSTERDWLKDLGRRLR